LTNQGVSRIFALRNRRDGQAFGKLGRQILHAVDGQIDGPGQQRLFDFLGEHALGADLGEGNIGDPVAGGLDDFNFDVMPALLEQRFDVTGLPQGKLRSAGTNA
jgi:hypothetical protein